MRAKHMDPTHHACQGLCTVRAFLLLYSMIILYNSVKELMVVLNSAYQMFDFARKMEPPEHAFSLLCHAASYLLYAIAQIDEAATNDDSSWKDTRGEIIRRLKEALREWIVRGDVIGGSVFGRAVLQYNTSIKGQYKGKEELQVSHH